VKNVLNKSLEKMKHILCQIQFFHKLYGILDKQC